MTDVPGMPGSKDSKRHLRSAAYCAFGSLVNSSQTQAKWFTMALGECHGRALQIRQGIAPGPHPRERQRRFNSVLLFPKTRCRLGGLVA